MSSGDPQAEREAQRYEFPIPSREAIVTFLNDSGQLLTAENLARGLGLSHARDVDALTKRLAAMLRDGQLLQNRRGAYGVASKLDLIPGAIIANAEGFGFLRPDAGGDVVYLSPAEMRKVLHGDRALISIVGVDRRGRKQGAICEVLERRVSRLVGRIVVENGIVVVAPDDRRMHQDILIPPGKDRGARSGQIVVAEITQPPTAQRGPIGEVISVLGERLTPSIVTSGSLRKSTRPLISSRVTSGSTPEVSSPPRELRARMSRKIGERLVICKSTWVFVGTSRRLTRLMVEPTSP